jgi:hypothetical protein
VSLRQRRIPAAMLTDGLLAVEIACAQVIVAN